MIYSILDPTFFSLQRGKRLIWRNHSRSAAFVLDFADNGERKQRTAANNVANIIGQTIKIVRLLGNRNESCGVQVFRRNPVKRRYTSGRGGCDVVWRESVDLRSVTARLVAGVLGDAPRWSGRLINGRTLLSIYVFASFVFNSLTDLYMRLINYKNARDRSYMYCSQGREWNLPDIYDTGFIKKQTRYGYDFCVTMLYRAVVGYYFVFVFVRRDFITRAFVRSVRFTSCVCNDRGGLRAANYFPRSYLLKSKF